MLSLFIALALLGLSLILPANSAPSPQLKELGDSFVMNANIIIPFDPNDYNIPINPYTVTTPPPPTDDPVLKAQIDFNSATTEPVILAQISDQGFVPNPDHGNLTGDPDIEAGDNCRKTKSLFCCKGRYDTVTQKVAQPCMLWRTENAIFCNHATFYCCRDLDGQTNGNLCSPISTAV